MKARRLARAWDWCAIVALALVALGKASPAGAAPSGGGVTVPFSSWARMLREVRGKAKAPRASAALSVISRQLDGRFERGTLIAKLELRVVVHRDGYVSVPVLPATVSVTDVRLDGRRATLLAPAAGASERHYRVGVSKRGSHLIRATFISGRSRARFSRRVRLSLPAGGTTKLSMTIPELRVRAHLRGGAITSTSERGGASHVVGYVDGNGRIDLGWTRELDQAARTKTRMSARQHCLYTLADAVARGMAVFDINVLDGETDRFDLRVPRGVEILSVKGRAVLQWRMLEHSGRLAVLLRHLVSGRERVIVRFQAPLGRARKGANARAARDVSLPLLQPLATVAHSGVVAVQAPAVLDVKLASKRTGKPHDSNDYLGPRDVPAALAALTRSPLLFGVRLDGRRASLALRIKRRRAVVLARTLIDHMQAATMVLADGSEITKVKLHLRNNTRQYLRLRLPRGARLLHVLIDGLVAATSREGDALLLPLRQSERIFDKRGRTHRVRDGQTLGDIAHFYYSDPAKWPLILRANRGVLRDEKSIQVGQQLRIPSKGPVTVEESSFVIELAYRLQAGALGSYGRRRLALPALDVDATRTTWHVYLPAALTPLSFDGDVTQLTAVRYGPLRRALRFFKLVFGMPTAHAGGGKYQSILARRKRIYRAEARARHGASASPGTFPLLGRRYRFRRLLPTRAGLSLEVLYLGATLGKAVRAGCFVLAAALWMWLLGAARRRLWHWLGALCGSAGLIAVAHYVSGVHRALAWALALASTVALLRLLRRWRRERVALADDAGSSDDGERLIDSPWLLLRRVRFYHLLLALGVTGLVGFALRYPPLVPLVASGLLLSTLRLCERRRLRALREAHDASPPPPSAPPPSAPPPSQPPPSQPPRSRAASSVIALLCALSIGASLLLAPPVVLAAGGFDAIVAPQNVAPRDATSPAVARSRASRALMPGLAQVRVHVPLARFDRAYRALLDKLDTRRVRDAAPALLYAESSYQGRAERGHLRLVLSLRVVLGREGVYKRVPLIGAGAALISAKADGRAIGVTSERGYHVWHTARTGEVNLEVTALVAPRGPRGSIEFDVAVVRTPVTRVRCRFPKGALQPRIDGAARAEVRHPDKRSTELSAALRPTTRLHLLGFRDLGAGSARRARVFAETINLLSLEPGRRELFSVIRYTILYAGARSFNVALPAGMQLVSASGAGGLRTTLTRGSDGGSVLHGETAYAIKGRYELSLRLRHRARSADGAAPAASSTARAAKTRQRFDAPLPRCLEVERQSGWLAVEVPGTLELREVARQHIAPVDVRQLPDALVRSAVAPILAAYRYDDTARRVTLATRRLPEQRLASEAVDRLRAFTVVAGDGRALHEIRLTLRNRTRRSISLTTPSGFKLRSAHLDGRPVQASVDDAGRVVLPLSRSRHGERLTLHVVFASRLDGLRWLGVRSLELPRVSLAVSSLVWTVFAPRRNIYGKLAARGGGQSLFGHLRWQRPAVSGAPIGHGDADSSAAAGATQADLDASSGSGGAMPVRIKVPKRGQRLEAARYWIRSGEAVSVSLPFVARAVLYPALGLCALLLLAALLLLLRRACRWPLRIGASALALGSGALLWRLVSPTVTVGLVMFVLLVQGVRSGVLLGAASSALVWARGLRRRFAERALPAAPVSRLALLRQIVLLAALLVVVGAALLQTIKLLRVLL